MARSNEMCASPAVRLETMPVVLSANALGSGLPGQLLSIVASLGMTLLTLAATVS